MTKQVYEILYIDGKNGSQHRIQLAANNIAEVASYLSKNSNKIQNIRLLSEVEDISE